MKRKIRAGLILQQRHSVHAAVRNLAYCVRSLHTRQNLAVKKILGTELVRRLPRGILARGLGEFRLAQSVKDEFDTGGDP